MSVTLTERELTVLECFARRQTNAEIARDLSLSVGTVKWYAQQIFNKLGVSNRKDAVTQAQALGLFAIGSKTETTQPVPHNLPAQPTPFIGRNHDIDSLVTLLQKPDCRLLTILGPGGMGKTRLAIELTKQSAVDFAAGAVFVDLQAVDSTELLPTSIAEAVGLTFSGKQPPLAQLIRYLADKALLLTLDNFEQLIEAAHFLADLLAQAPNLKILVTSRELLNLQEEWLFPIGGLSFPKDLADEAWLTYEAVRLLIERVQRIRPNWEAEIDRQAIIRICQLVEGMPLALELAAVWARSLSMAEIAAEIEHDLTILQTSLRNIPSRHQSMELVFDQTWAQLSVEEQSVFARLSVFRGSFERKATQAVAMASLPILNALVEKSLLRHSHDGRYSMHELLRQFALEKLKQTGDEAEQVARRHSRYFAEFTAQCYERYLVGQFRAVIADLMLEFDNLRAAWHWLINQMQVEQNQAFALEYLSMFTHPLAWFYRQWSRYVAGKAAFQAAETALGNLLTSDDLPSDFYEQIKVERARLQTRLATLCYFIGEYEQVDTLIESALPIMQEVQLIEEEAFALEVRARIVRRRGDYAQTKALAQRVGDLYRQAGNEFGTIMALNHIAVTAADEGDYALAEHTGAQIADYYRQLNDTASLCRTLNNLGNTYIRQGKHQAAKPVLEEAYTLAQEDNNRFALVMTRTNLAHVARELGNFAEAETHNRASLALARAMGDQRWLAANLNGLSHNNLAQHNWRSAESYAQEALAITTHIRSESDALGDISCLGRAWAHQGKIEPALCALLYVAQHPSATIWDKEQSAMLLNELSDEVPPAIAEEAEQWVEDKTLDDVMMWASTVSSL